MSQFGIIHIVFVLQYVCGFVRICFNMRRLQSVKRFDSGCYVYGGRLLGFFVFRGPVMSKNAFVSVLVLVLFFYVGEVLAGQISEPSSGQSGSRYRSYYTAKGGVEKVYYDYVEDGLLKGGIIEVELAEPLSVEAADVRASWEVTVITDNGASGNRVDLVVLGDGYTATERSVYASHVNTGLNGFFNELPLNVYSSYFNIHRVEVISNESGVDVPDDGIYVNTALDMAFSGRLLTINTSKAFEAADCARAVDITLALGNTSIYGGAGYSNLATAAGNNGSTIDLILHEMGHSFGKLADEYDYGGPETYTGSEPPQINVSIYDAIEQLALERKWYRWLDLPNVDTFEGAMYSTYGIYRPTYNSLMRSLGRPFEEVNVEQWILRIYEYVSPIDGATESSAEALPAHTEFFVVPLEPVGHLLDIQWFIDGVEVVGAVDTTFQPDSLELSPGIHELSVTVVDNTTMVRDEDKRAALMMDRREWLIERWGEDMNRDGKIDINDFGLFSGYWMESNCIEENDFCGGASFDGDLDVDEDDLLMMVDRWLRGVVPAGYWKFDEGEGMTAYDAGVFGRDGSLINMDEADWVDWLLGSCLAFDGIDDYVLIDGYKGLRGWDSRTCSAWIKTESVSGEIICWGDISSVGTKWVFRVDESGGLRVEVKGGYIIGSTDLTDNVWHHVAAVLENDGSPNVDEVRLFVDGEEDIISAVASQAVKTNNSVDVRIGSFTTEVRFFNGLVDEVRIYERALSTEEVSALAD
jgi:hypothetical protein